MEFEKIWVLASASVNGVVYADALIVSSLIVLMTTVSIDTFAVGVIDATLAEPPVPPVPSLANTTVSPTE